MADEAVAADTAVAKRKLDVDADEALVLIKALGGHLSQYRESLAALEEMIADGRFSARIGAQQVANTEHFIAVCDRLIRRLP